MAFGKPSTAQPFSALFIAKLQHARQLADGLPIDPILGSGRADLIRSLREAIELGSSIPSGKRGAQQLLQAENSYRQSQLKLKELIELLNAQRPGNYHELHSKLIDISLELTRAVLAR